MTERFGIDISGWQPKIDWKALGASDAVSFVYVKATEGTHYRSKHAVGQAQGAASIGLPTGLYHFADPSPDDSPEEEAKHFLGYARELATHGPLMLRPTLDLEKSSGASPQRLLDWAERWVRVVEQETGQVSVLYTYESYLKQHLSKAGPGLLRCPLWIAKYSKTAPKTKPWITWAMWQYTQKGKVAGIPGQVDCNRGASPIIA